MLEENGSDLIKKIRSFVTSKEVKRTIAVGTLLGRAIIYPVKTGLFISGALLLSTVVVLVDKISKGQISQTGKYTPISAWA